MKHLFFIAFFLLLFSCQKKRYATLPCPKNIHYNKIHVNKKTPLKPHKYESKSVLKKEIDVVEEEENTSEEYVFSNKSSLVEVKNTKQINNFFIEKLKKPDPELNKNGKLKRHPATVINTAVFVATFFNPISVFVAGGLLLHLKKKKEYFRNINWSIYPLILYAYMSFSGAAVCALIFLFTFDMLTLLVAAGAGILGLLFMLPIYVYQNYKE